jgi:hypothetical protein
MGSRRIGIGHYNALRMYLCCKNTIFFNIQEYTKTKKPCEYLLLRMIKTQADDEKDQHLLNSIEEIGWHVLKIMADDEGPGFVYSVGLFKTFGHPEIIIIGLSPDLAHVLINNIGEDIRTGKHYNSGEFYDNIVTGFDCAFLQVPKMVYRDYFGYALWYYEETAFPVVQCIYPTTKGYFPWQKEWPEDLISLQPVLGDLAQIS